ncbi:MAG: hypothetical protein KY439_08565 [Actinobacteria bacterium]|nr:hypothetical protein [Actinomycetota bacterium]
MSEVSLWCPNCAAEYREGVAVCADCAVALSDTPPAEEEDSQVIVYELDDLTPDQRGALELRLQTDGIEHQWETPSGADVEANYEGGQPWAVASDLVVGEKDEEAVDAILDEIESPDALQAVDADGADDEATYAVMGQLYVAADRLKDDPGDLALAGEFFDAADAARSIDPPFGIDPEVWRRVQELAGEVSSSIEQEEDDEVVAAHAQRLRDVLFTYV